MPSETELLDSSGLVAMLRDPNTGEVVHLTFPPGKYEIALEVHLPARIAKVTLRAVRIPRGGEYDVRLVFDTNPEPPPPFLPELADAGTLTHIYSRETITPGAPLGPPVTSVMPQRQPEVTPVTSLQVDPSVPVTESLPAPVGATVAVLPVQAPQEALSEATTGTDGSNAQEPPQAPTQAPLRVPTKETPKGPGVGGRRGL